MFEKYGENNVQTAISQSLQAWARDSGRNMLQFPPYANQQGEQLKRYCGDLLGILEGADLVALEVKEYDVHRRVLPRFNQHQHDAALFFAHTGVPLAYAYNAVEKLAYHEWPQPHDWPERTLSQVNRSTPEELEDQHPKVDEHGTLLEWLQGAHDTDASSFFGATHGLLQSTDRFTNGILVLLYSASGGKLASFDADQLGQAVQVLNGNQNYLDARQLTQLQDILSASQQTMDAFAKFRQPSQPQRNTQRPRP